LLSALRSEVIRLRGELQYYSLNYLAGVALNLILFGGIYFALTEASDTNQVNVLYLLVAYLVWYYASDILGQMSLTVLEEAMLGTLEQVYISRTPIHFVLLARTLSSLVKTSLFIIVFLIIVAPAFDLLDYTAGLGVADWIALVGICAVALIAATGLGLTLFGLSILFKRVGAVKMILDFVLLMFSGVFVSVKELPLVLKTVASFFPFTWALESLRLLVSQGMSASEVVSRGEWLAALVAAAAYLCTGALIASWCLDAGRRRGALAHY
jgi:ABC-2 type transport system permease protein